MPLGLSYIQLAVYHPFPFPPTSMPWALSTAHESFLQCPLFQIPDKVAVVAPPRLLRSAASPRLPRRRLMVHASEALWRRRVVGRAGLKSDRLGGI